VTSEGVKRGNQRRDDGLCPECMPHASCDLRGFSVTCQTPLSSVAHPRCFRLDHKPAHSVTNALDIKAGARRVQCVYRRLQALILTDNVWQFGYSPDSGFPLSKSLILQEPPGASILTPSRSAVRMIILWRAFTILLPRSSTCRTGFPSKSGFPSWLTNSPTRYEAGGAGAGTEKSRFFTSEGGA